MKYQPTAKGPFKAMWDRKTDILVTSAGIFLVGIVLPAVYSIYHDFTLTESVLRITVVLLNTSLLWMGCRLIINYLGIKLPWPMYPVRHILAEVVLITAYTFIITIVLWQLINFIGAEYFGPLNFWYEFAGSAGISLLISFLHEAYYFYQQWKSNLIRSETLEKENIVSKYETLKNQVNPHFLFNSLNTLLGLIEEDQNAAKGYLENMSDFFRQILQSAEKPVISLAEELDMISKYYELQQKRYGDGFRLTIKLPEDCYQSLIPPLTLQMLLENALKHNSVASKSPLEVSIVHTENDYLVIRNNIQKRQDRQHGTGTGLNNIISRYSLISSKDVMINHSAVEFVVALPVIRSYKPINQL